MTASRLSHRPAGRARGVPASAGFSLARVRSRFAAFAGFRSATPRVRRRDEDHGARQVAGMAGRGRSLQRVSGHRGGDDRPPRLRRRRVREAARARRLHRGRRGRDHPRARRPLHRPRPLRLRAAADPAPAAGPGRRPPRDRRSGAAAADRAAGRAADLPHRGRRLGRRGADRAGVRDRGVRPRLDRRDRPARPRRFAEVPHYILTHAVNLRLEPPAGSPSAPTAGPARSWSRPRARPTCCSSRRPCRGPSAPGSAAT